MSTNNSDRQQLFLIVQGISSELTAEQAAKNQGRGQVPTYWDSEKGVPGIVPFLQQTQFPNAFFFVYSYQGSMDNGNPMPYDCTKTFINPLRNDILALNTQLMRILAAIGKPTDVYLIGHSLGGVVAFGYLAYLNSSGGLHGSIPDFPQTNLKGVVTLDSPIGGVTDNTLYQVLIKDVLAPKSCPGIKNLPLPSVDNLVQIFLTNQGAGHPQGADASLSQALYGVAVNNQALAERAAAVGIPVLTIGNTSDLFWDPAICGDRKGGDFRTTQWVLDDAQKQIAVYGRDFTDGELKCKLEDFLPNHLAVLHNTRVEAGLNQFFPSGGEPTALTVAPRDLPMALAGAPSGL